MASLIMSEQSLAARIDLLLAAARSAGHAHQVVEFGLATEWLVACGCEHGLDLAGMAHAADTSAVRHVLQQHGDAAREMSLGQLPVRDLDLRAIPEILLAPDRLVFGLNNRRKQDQIVYIKRMQDGTTLYIEGVRGARKRLAPASMRRFHGTIDATRLMATLDPHARSASKGRLVIVDVPIGRKALAPFASPVEGPSQR